jgi:hypothetical protein
MTLDGYLSCNETAGVWTVVSMKPEMKVLPDEWVYGEKMDSNTGKPSARARQVVCCNYEDVYVAVASSFSVKTFMALTILNAIGLISKLHF